VALLFSGAPALAADGDPTTTVPSTDTTVPAPPAVPPSTVPPPPPFGLPMDAGQKLLDQQHQAEQELDALEPELVTATHDRDALQTHWDDLTTTLARLDRTRQATAIQLDLARSRLRQGAAQAYVSSGSGKVEAAIRSLNTNDVMQVSRDLHIISTYGDYEIERVEHYEDEVDRLVDEIVVTSKERADVKVKLDAANANVLRVQRAIDDANRRIDEAKIGIERFHQLAATAGSPIQGPNRLTAAQMAEFIRRGGYTPHITVTIDELAQLYLEESAKVGIRGDVAWAQSILETGGFGFAGSMVEPEDNNFAGIGACDSCKRGFRFPDARTGVRAQMQLLRIYTDKSVTLDSLPDPVVLPGTLRLGFRGRVQSWWDLTGTWATAGDYGIRVYELYERIVAETADVVEPPPADPNAPAAPDG
jgi:hypothetical protein